MENKSKSAEDIKAIRKIMEDSTRFLSLSGYSGIFAGMFAIAGALAAWFLVLNSGGRTFNEYFGAAGDGLTNIQLWNLAGIALLVLSCSLVSAFYFSVRKAKKDGRSIWNPVSRRLLSNLFIPLLSGGIFTIALFLNGQINLIIPCLLLFYGLALVSAGKFTMGEVFYLGILEIVCGLVAAFIPGFSLLFWIMGFGLLNIGYGLVMYRKLGI